jgi:hypothetical protein
MQGEDSSFHFYPCKSIFSYEIFFVFLTVLNRTTSLRLIRMVMYCVFCKERTYVKIHDSGYK